MLGAKILNKESTSLLYHTNHSTTASTSINNTNSNSNDTAHRQLERSQKQEQEDNLLDSEASSIGAFYQTKSIDEEDEQTVPSDLWKKPPLIPLRIQRAYNNSSSSSSFHFNFQQQKKQTGFHSTTNGKSLQQKKSIDQFDFDSHDASSPLLHTCVSNIRDYSSSSPPIAKKHRQRSLSSSDQLEIDKEYPYNHSYSYSSNKHKRNIHPTTNLDQHEVVGTNLQPEDSDISVDSSTHNSTENTHMDTSPSKTKGLFIHNIRDIDQESIQRTRHNQSFGHTVAGTGTGTGSSTLQESSSTMRRTWMKIMRCVTHNPVSKCIARLPTLADACQSSPSNNIFALWGLILQHPKMSFGGLLASCILLDVVLILPGYLLSFLVTEYGVYLILLVVLWRLGRFVLRMIAFPGATPRLRREIEGEFQRYSVKMLDNAVEAIGELAMLIISKENSALLGGRDVKMERMLGKTYGRYDVIPLWQKVSHYRDRVLGMYHDVLHCLLVEDGNGLGEGEDDSGLTRFGNNPMHGDVGKLLDVSENAKAGGKELISVLKKVLDALGRLEAIAGDYMKSTMDTIGNKAVTPDGIRAAKYLFVTVNELRECLLSLEDPDSSVADDSDNESQESEMKGRRKALVAEGMNSVKSAINGILDTLDPPPLRTIFGLDVLRGTMLSRYRGAQQIWIQKHGCDGYIDAIHIPSDGVYRKASDNDRIEKAVMFCNPNAGLVEVAAGLSLISGNVSEPTSLECTCWTDYYLEHGYDIILFNYTGYGRSHMGNRKTKSDLMRGMHVFRRICSSTVFGFKPSPHSLKVDATDAATYIIENLHVNKFLIHGESIGGMAASGAANAISKRKYVDSNTLPVTYPTMLLCDRTFCNLNATAYRLVGSWTRFVIPLLTPTMRWSTDVAGDFISATCRKVVAQDAQDAIIHDASSLKKGIATAMEFTKGITTGLGTFGDAPLTYRMADHENVGVQESKYAEYQAAPQVQAPVWPSDKHIDLPEAFHFAACARRIGKVATNIRKRKLLDSTEKLPYEDEEEGIEITTVFSRDVDEQTSESNQSDEDIILQVWDTLGLCDGCAGLPLGAAVRDGYDSTIDWLSEFVTLGSQRVVLSAEKRCKTSKSSRTSFENITVENQDFEVSFLPTLTQDESGGFPPLPLPYVSQALQAVLESCGVDSNVKHPIHIGKCDSHFLDINYSCYRASQINSV